MAQVASSWLVIWKQPSPSIAHTSLSGRADLGPHRRRHRVAHRPRSAGVDPGIGLVVGDELRRPHLVLPDAGGEHRVRAGDLPQPLDHVLRRQAAVGGVLVTQRVGPAPAVDLAATSRPGRAVAGRVLGPHRRGQLGDHLTGVAHDRNVGHPVLADLGGVDVGVDHRRVRGEGVEPAGHPVVEPGAERDQQIRLLQRGHRGHRAVHAGHAQVLVVRVRERAARHQRGDHRNAGQLGQLGELGAGAGLEHPAADVEHRRRAAAISLAASRICLPCGLVTGR